MTESRLSGHGRGHDFPEDSSSRGLSESDKGDGISDTPSPAGLNLTKLTGVSARARDHPRKNKSVIRRVVDLRSKSDDSGFPGLPWAGIPLKSTSGKPPREAWTRLGNLS